MSSDVVIDHILFFGRTYEEVVSMFALSADELASRRILDCNSGPDAFVGEARRRGYDVTGVDPLYAEGIGEIVAAGKKDVAHFLERSHGQDENVHLDMQDFARKKLDALEQFTEDFAAGQEAGHHVAGALPELPFDDGSFDLVVSGHFLFVSAPPEFGGMIREQPLDFAFHQAAVRELLRVSREEVRLFPVTCVGSTTNLHPWAMANSPPKATKSPLSTTVTIRATSPVPSPFPSANLRPNSLASEATANKSIPL